MKRVFMGLAVVAMVFIVLAGIKFVQIRALISFAKNFTPPPETISSAVAQTETWQDTLSAVGSVNAEQGVMVSPEVAGMISEIDFESGAAVNQGDLLIKLDASSEEAQLRSLEAQSDLARLTAERTRKLRADKTVAQSDLDAAEAALKQDVANADEIRAEINKKTIRAPFAGQLGIRQVNLGQQLDAGAAIVSLQSLAPVFVDFSLPQQDLAQLQTGLKVRAMADAYPDRQFEGELTAINPDLDTATRSVRLRAKFVNADKLLRPGMFARVEVLLPSTQPVLAIPVTAVLSAPYGDAVYLISEQVTNNVTNLVVQQTLIRTGRTHGDFISVESGLKPGDRVVSAGLFKLHNGAPVQINNEITPKPQLSPQPSDS